MGNIVYIVAIIFLNMILKNVQEKRRTEAQRDKRMSQSMDRRMAEDRDSRIVETRSKEVIQPSKTAKKEKEPSLFQELYALLNEEIERKTQTSKPEVPKGKDLITCPETSKKSRDGREEWVGSQAKITESVYEDFNDEHYSRGGHRDLDEEARLEKERKAEHKARLRKDIVQGIIFSEILSEPKSMRRKM